ncbi:uncharacterized protein [Amphiura filiformis]|uniref:uncharacterized protein n=1 Tax=Amphiura filiformis TaxID=82378 RepID=UPI003B20B9ED
MMFFTKVLSSLATATILIGLCRSKPSGDMFRFRILSKKEVYPIHVWPPPSDKVTFKNCGPPASCSFSPWPLALKEKTTMECNITAAHTLIDGDVAVNLNKWPYSVSSNACQTFREHYKSEICPLKKGEMFQLFYSGFVRLDSDMYLGQTEVKFTITNSEDEALLCFSLSVNL